MSLALLVDDDEIDDDDDEEDEDEDPPLPPPPLLSPPSLFPGSRNIKLVTNCSFSNAKPFAVFSITLLKRLRFPNDQLQKNAGGEVGEICFLVCCCGGSFESELELKSEGVFSLVFALLAFVKDEDDLFIFLPVERDWDGGFDLDDSGFVVVCLVGVLPMMVYYLLKVCLLF